MVMFHHQPQFTINKPQFINIKLQYIISNKSQHIKPQFIVNQPQCIIQLLCIMLKHLHIQQMVHQLSIMEVDFVNISFRVRLLTRENQMGLNMVA